MLNAKALLKEIHEDELESGERLVFADNIISCEEKFSGMIAGSYKISGRSDRLANISGRTEVIDFKYSKNHSRFNIPARTTVLERFKERSILHPAAQLIIYQHFIKGSEGARFCFLKESKQDRIVTLPLEQSVTSGELMTAIKERLDLIITGSELLPDYTCQECEYCLFKALCGRENYYKDSLGNN
jgi:hypothetical protein